MIGGNHHTADSESLQTDVMRFMAIIAFCLIAILALVRNSEPGTTRQPAPDPGVESHAEPRGIQPPEPAPAISQVPPLPDASTAPLRALEPLPRLPDEEPGDGSLEPADPRTPGTDAPSDQAVSATAQEAAAERGLSLRFATDRDFMRLIARGEVQVYAFRADDVLSLDRSFRFLESPAPARLYPLEPATIPRLVTGALDAHRGATDGYAWGIRMPERLEARIQALVGQGASGQLVIDRYGEVLHVDGG